MLNPTPGRRARALKRAPEPLRRLAAETEGRGRIRSALLRCAGHERAVLALLLFERLTPREAADALGISVPDVLRTYEALLTELRRAARGLRFRLPRTPAARATAAASEPRARRA